MVGRGGPRIGIRVVSTDAAIVRDFLEAANNFLRLEGSVSVCYCPKKKGA